MTAPDDATRRQHDAARPDQSTWLSANAGSGKTRVLTDRVARLLLAGVDPQNILCLTYTKAAAAEMQNRLFGRLGAWAMLSDAALVDQLEGIGVGDPVSLPEARTLFARALETPGGLKIQTIHSFCAALLRRFPLEAGVSPQFTEMEDAAALRLMADVANQMASGASVAALDGVAACFGGETIEALAREVVRHQDAFPPALTREQALQLLDLRPDASREGLAAEVFTGPEDDLLERLCAELAAGSATDLAAKAALDTLRGRPMGYCDLTTLESVFLFKSGATPFAARIDRFPTKDTRGRIAGMMDALNDWMVRVEAARPVRLALEAAERTLALHRFADAFLPAYKAAKATRGWLDFDDLIRTTRSLLEHSPAAAWVLYRLDGRIDHILVDEAQDTSPAQWDVIASLAQEMTSGAGAGPDTGRSLFVVGDKKQSIYSFQGADPDAFDRMQDHFQARMATQGGLTRLQLEYSFRSSGAVLAAVDETYSRTAGASDRDGLRHRPFHIALPGRVDLWPPVGKETAEKPDHWWDPVDLKGANHHSVRLAQKVAAFIRDAIRDETLPDAKGHRRRIHEGDFLILVQGRQTGLFHNIIRACKSERLAVAGADRLRLAGELAVRDVLSLLKFVALPEDDLSLAEALRSPLFGWTEHDLYTLATGRPGYLWTALREARGRHAETLDAIDALRGQADFRRPFDLIEMILTRLGGRARLIARLGLEVEDALDELLNQALAYETVEVPSLTGFLEWTATGQVEVKRQAESAGRQVRVMTVHGAKGLESPIVILPDTLKSEQDRTSEILKTDRGVALWAGRKDNDPEVMRAARERNFSADQRERDRLLYVAMTRAEKWLVVCGAGDRPKAGGTWYDEVEAGLEAAGAAPCDMPTGPGLRLTVGDWTAGALVDGPPANAPDPVFPDWTDRAASPPEVAEGPISPSDLGGSKSLAGEEAAPPGAGGTDWGTALHLLLEHLPRHHADMWEGLAQTLLADAPLDIRAAVTAEARAILADPSLGFVFGPDTLAEVPIAARPKAFGGRALAGTIDRLVFENGGVLAVDFKSNRVVPQAPEDVPDGVMRQMAAYVLALREVYPDRRIDVAILWTRDRRLMRLPHDIVMASLQSPATS